MLPDRVTTLAERLFHARYKDAPDPVRWDDDYLRCWLHVAREALAFAREQLPTPEELSVPDPEPTRQEREEADALVTRLQRGACGARLASAITGGNRQYLEDAIARALAARRPALTEADVEAALRAVKLAASRSAHLESQHCKCCSLWYAAFREAQDGKR